MPVFVGVVNRIVSAIRICVEGIHSSVVQNLVRIDEPPRLRIIIPRLKEVETEVIVVEVASVAERVQETDGGNSGTGCR